MSSRADYVIAALALGSLVAIGGFLAGGLYSTTGDVSSGYVQTNRLTGSMSWCVGGQCEPVAFSEPEAPGARVGSPQSLRPTLPPGAMDEILRDVLRKGK